MSQQRLSESELSNRLSDAAQRIHVGGVYRHYKGGEYQVVGLAIDEATSAPVVVYRAESDGHITFVRPLSVWLETVETPGGRMPRFAQL